jgi:hypothetical protein
VGLVTAPDASAHDWQDLPFWRAELERKPPAELAAAAHLWRRAVILRWIEAAGGNLSCADSRVLLPKLPPCPATNALLQLARELEEERSP